MKSSNKKTAFTIAEILIAIFIAGIIAILFIKATISTTTHYQNNLLSYAAMDSLSVAAYDLAQTGCTTTPTTGDIAMGYCTAATGVLPYKDYATAGTRSFCSRLVTEEFSIIPGTNHCDVAPTATDTTTDFSGITPAFVTTNGMKFYFINGQNPYYDATLGYYYQLYIDIDGPKRKSKYNEDVLQFRVTIDGTVLPNSGGIASNSTDYLTASIRYVDTANNKYVYPMTGITYRQAACLSNTLTTAFPLKYHSTYCDPRTITTVTPNIVTPAYTTQAGTPASVCKPCPTTGIHDCEVVLDNPGILGNYIDINAIK